MRAALALLICLGTVPALAGDQPQTEEQYFPQQMTAKELLYACASSSLTRPGRDRKRYCHGFVSGAEETARLLAAQSPSTGKQRYCFPEGKTAGYFAEVFMRHASKTTTDLDRPAVLVVIEALEKSFSCED